MAENAIQIGKQVRILPDPFAGEMSSGQSGNVAAQKALTAGETARIGGVE